MDDNLSCVLAKPGEIVPENRPVVPPAEGEVQVAVHNVGICGSDVHYWKHGRIGDFIVTAPMVLGHESSGVVVAVGDRVDHLKVGDRVAMEPAVPCRICHYCKIGRYNLCPDIKCLSTPPYNGSLARFHNHAADFCFKLPDNVSMEEGALLEPLSVGIHACRRASVTLGNTVLICGAGPIGLVCMLTAKAMGASQICITDISEQRINFAKSLGANHGILVDTKDSYAIAKKVKEALGDLADITIECSGAEASVQLGIRATKSGGCMTLVGMGPPEVKVPIVEAGVREVDIKGIFRYVNTYPTAIKMVSSGAVDVKPLVTHRYKLEESVDAFERAYTGAGNAFKVMISCKK